MNILRFLWEHPLLLWPTAIVVHIAIGTAIGLFMYWKYCRHHYIEHGWRGGEFKNDSGCWCGGDDCDAAVRMGYTFAPVLWPGIVAGYIVYRIIIAPIIYIARCIIGLYAKIENLASWDGVTIEGAHPTAISKSEALADEISKTNQEIKERTQKLIRDLDQARAEILALREMKLPG